MEMVKIKKSLHLLLKMVKKRPLMVVPFILGTPETEGSTTIMSTLFALEFWSNKIIDVDTMLFITLAVS